MTTISSEKRTLHATTSDVIDFIKNTDNLIEVFPTDRIEDWKSNTVDCSFKIKGLARISLKLDHNDDAIVRFSSGEESPFPFTLTLHTSPEGDNTNAQLVFEGDMNPMLSMMAKKPLTNFFNMVIDNAAAYYNK